MNEKKNIYRIETAIHKDKKCWVVKNPDGRISNDCYHKTYYDAARHLANIVAFCVDPKEWKYYNLEDTNKHR